EAEEEGGNRESGEAREEAPHHALTVIPGAATAAMARDPIQLRDARSTHTRLPETRRGEPKTAGFRFTLFEEAPCARTGIGRAASELVKRRRVLGSLGWFRVSGRRSCLPPSSRSEGLGPGPLPQLRRPG